MALCIVSRGVRWDDGSFIRFGRSTRLLVPRHPEAFEALPESEHCTLLNRVMDIQPCISCLVNRETD